MKKFYPRNSFSSSSSFSSEFSNQNNIDCDCTYEGILHPEPNIYICKIHCCIKFIGLYIFLFGCIFGITFPLVGFTTKLIIFTVTGFTIFFICLIIAILISCLLTIEVKFTFIYSTVEIITSSVCWSKKKIVDIKEIADIYFEYTQKGRGVYHSLHIRFKNGIENSYFNLNSRPPCFTKYEVDYFNNEVKRLLEN